MKEGKQEQTSDRWQLLEGKGIVWIPKPGEPSHLDHIEASGERVSLILPYGTDDNGHLVRKVTGVWPMLRTLPNNTHASLKSEYTSDRTPSLIVNGINPSEVLDRVTLDGVIHLNSSADGISIERDILPSRTAPAIIERVKVTNHSDRVVGIDLVPANESLTTDPTKGLQGSYVVVATSQGTRTLLQPGQSANWAITYTAYPANEPYPEELDADQELRQRQSLIDSLQNTLVLETPDASINQMFAFAKVRACESIFATKGGKIHCPGGGSYYAAIWANDQAEYANPLFGYLGHSDGVEAASTSFDWFARYMNPEFRPIPSSIIAEGTDIWNGAGDRGDMAMIAYGAARYVLALGNRQEAERLWPLIEWCLDYLETKVTHEGVIASDSDELENRFPAGKANLNTACLAYDALLSAAALASDLGVSGATQYREWADRLALAIEKHFGWNVEGFDTYRYYEGNDVLRAWICTPLAMGLSHRASQTIEALFSPRLWTVDGLATQAGDETFWDRSTLYGFRGALAAGATERVMPFFMAYTKRRLLGEHVPYTIEAWPEGDQRHLSAESALYCRAVTEGLFGLRPTGLRSFQIFPRLPQAWNAMSLHKISIAGHAVDLDIERTPDGVRATVSGVSFTSQEYAVTDRPITVSLNDCA